jgi:hypothetical protein
MKSAAVRARANFGYVTAAGQTAAAVAAALVLPFGLAFALSPVEAIAYSIFASLIFPTWVVIGVSWRYLLPLVLTEIAVFIDQRRFGGGTAHDPVAAAMAVAYVALSFAVLRFSRRYDREASVDLGWPFKTGSFACFQGGSTVFLNHHHRVAAQRYACDLVRLNRFGTRASGVVPRRLDAYCIFATRVVSPCDGTVVAAVDCYRGEEIGGVDHDGCPPFGNHVAVRRDDVVVLLAHLRFGSVRVRAGDTVRRGDELARVGNSGNSSEPHLHIHAERNGVGVPMTFDGRYLVRNDVLRVGAS